MREEYPEEEDYEVDIEDGEYEEWLSYQGCEMVPSLRAGSGLLFDTDTIHRGGAHVDPDAPERVVVFLAFAGSRRGKDDGRSLPFGKVHSLHWRSWGLTVDDLGALDARPSRWWHAFGLRFFDRNNGVRPWCIQDSESRRWNIVIVAGIFAYKRCVSSLGVAQSSSSRSSGCPATRARRCT